MIYNCPLIFLILVLGSMKPLEGRFVEDFVGRVRPCYLFEVGDPERMEFYSPNYPGRYPNHTDCNLILEAPEGHQVQVDFRDGFHLEPSTDCKYDFLEVRDGTHGYSRQVGVFCGHDYPPVIQSSGRHLWLRFHSDNNTEYTGFRAVYQYIPKTTQESVLPDCRIEMSGIEGLVNMTNIHPHFIRKSIDLNIPLDCVWVIRVEDGWRIQLWFDVFTLGVPNDCNANFLDIFNDKTDIPSRLNNFCGSIAETVLSESNILTLRFVSMPEVLKTNKTKFEALFTAFKEKQKGENCSDMNLFDCEDGNCIHMQLKCNNKDNCRYRGDEDLKLCEPVVTIYNKIIDDKYMIIIVLLFFLILFGMCCAFLYHCIKKLIRDHRIIREQMRRSRDAKLEQLGKKTPAGAVMTPLVAVVGKAHDRFRNWPNHRPKEDDSETESDDGGKSVVEMREVEIQTRESLFHSPGGSPRQTFKTFGYDDDDDDDNDDSASRPDDPRATSMESTKSAPDVIMSH